MTNKPVENASENASESPLTPLTLLGLGAMGTALAEAWLTAGHPLTVWNRTAARADALAVRGAAVAPTVAEAVAANRLIVVCLLDDASVDDALAGLDLTGKDLVNVVTSTPGQARALSLIHADDRCPGGRAVRLLQRPVRAVRGAPRGARRAGRHPVRR